MYVVLHTKISLIPIISPTDKFMISEFIIVVIKIIKPKSNILYKAFFRFIFNTTINIIFAIKIIIKPFLRLNISIVYDINIINSNSFFNRLSFLTFQ